jgi:hypothetical protein
MEVNNTIKIQHTKYQLPIIEAVLILVEILQKGQGNGRTLPSREDILIDRGE